jgi:aminopeptidase N
VYYCGYRDVAGLLFFTKSYEDDTTSGARGGYIPGEPETFSFPGDRPTYAPDRPADVAHIDIDVTLDFAEESVRGVVTTKFSTLFEEIQEITLDAAELQIEQVSLDSTGMPLSFWLEGEKLHIQLDHPYRHGEEFEIRVKYSAHPRTGLVFVKPTEGNPDLPLQAWTQGETEYHHHWFVCHDFPNDRATTTLHATVPANFFALSNGRLEETRDNGDGTRTFSWRQDIPFPAYLVTLVAGEFSELGDTWRDMPVNYYVRPGREEDGRRMLGNTPQMIEFFSQKFGVDYPFVKYAQIVPELFLGAMENVSATTHSYRLLPDERANLDWSADPVVSHELVHQWHGDLLAVRDWSHTWLKESFATYFSATWTQHDRGEDEFRAALRQNLHNYLAADRRGRRPIVYNVYRKNGTELFDRHNYEKGSLVLHMLRNILGEGAFWRAIAHYTNRNRLREVITADFERAIEEATGRSVAQFFEQWLYKAGHPDFRVTYAWEGEKRLARVQVEQTQNATELTPLFRLPVDIGFLVPEDEDAIAETLGVATRLVVFRVLIEDRQQTFYFPLERRPFSVRFDQGGWLIKTLEFERSDELLRFQLRHDPDVLGRIEAAEALGKSGDRQSLEALEQQLLAEPFWAVRVAIAEALASRKSEHALGVLIRAVPETSDPKARRGIVAALGNFRAPEQTALATRAAVPLTALVEQGDRSYFVEAEAAAALGKTRVPGAFETLKAAVDTPSWNETIRSGIFTGLGELGDDRGADLLVSWLTDAGKPMDARAAAAVGLRVLAGTRRIDPGPVQTRIVEGLIAALEDPWEMVVVNAVPALGLWGDTRALAPLRRLLSQAVDERVVRGTREAIRLLERGETRERETRQLRNDVDELREQNRRLQEEMQRLEAQLTTRPSASEVV